MTSVQVTFPVLKGSRRFIIERGRRWSVIEHLLLDAVSRGPSSAVALSERSKLPRRVVVEAFIRLMRAGWVEILSTSQGPLFQVTYSGAIRVQQDQLPAATVTEPRWRGFAIEQVTGCVFRGRELELCHKNQLPNNTDEAPVAHLGASSLHALEDMSEVFTAIEGEDELIVGVDRSAEKLVERYAVVTVRDDVIEGLPARTPPSLRATILQAALNALGGRARSSTTKVSDVVISANGEQNEPRMRPAAYDPADLIIDGEEHKRAFDRVISSATERLIIHSTFISDERASIVLPQLLQAAQRGVRIDILWGQDDVGSSTKSSQAAAAKLQAEIDLAGHGGLVKVHPFSTNSHAKVVFSNSQKGWSALLGSCNWLASDFTSFETSFRLRDPYFVGSLIKKLAGLAQGRPGIWNDLAIEFAVLGRRVMDIQAPKGRTVPMRLLYGSDHAKLALEARDKAKQRIFALSHRIGIAAKPVALLPALAAAKATGIEAAFYYGRTTGPLSGVAGAELVREFARDGLQVRPVHRPRIHAKVLGWDDNMLAISSLNWLSADPSESAPYREIGILIDAPRIADNFITRFQAAVIA